MNKKTIFTFLLLLAFTFLARISFAQDPLAVAPEMYTLVFENERVRVMTVTFQPGEAIAEHSHPEHFAYVLEAGTLMITKGGETNVAELNLGDVVWLEAETHSAVNNGETPVKLLVVELKEALAAHDAPVAAEAAAAL